ncbi:MAG: hypothetical protein ACLT98_05220 [Eggerthellaceae bacterium]
MAIIGRAAGGAEVDAGKARRAVGEVPAHRVKPADALRDPKRARPQTPSCGNRAMCRRVVVERLARAAGLCWGSSTARR